MGAASPVPSGAEVAAGASPNMAPGLRAALGFLLQLQPASVLLIFSVLVRSGHMIFVNFISGRGYRVLCIGVVFRSLVLYFFQIKQNFSHTIPSISLNGVGGIFWSA